MHTITPRITHALCPPKEQLGAVWRNLESQAMLQGHTSFFTSWTWIGTWLETLEGRCQTDLWQAHDASGQLIGLAILVVRRKWLCGILPVRVGYLHETGWADCDAITIEHNGVLACETHRQAVTHAMLRAMMASGLDQLRCSGLRDLPDLGDMPWRMDTNSISSYNIDLAAITATQSDYLAFLKQRPRYLVRKSLKRLTQDAPLQIDAASESTQAADFLKGLIALHTRYWNSKGERGAFGTPFQRAFHQRLVATGADNEAVVLLRILHGDHLLGYLHFFCHQGWAHFYQSGIDYERYDATDSPGLAAHSLAIEYFRVRGLKVYDFMPGDMQYKRTLSSHTELQHWLTVSRRSVRIAIARRLRAAVIAARNRLRGMIVVGTTNRPPSRVNKLTGSKPAAPTSPAAAKSSPVSAAGSTKSGAHAEQPREHGEAQERETR